MIGHDIDAALPGLRAEAESLMLDAGMIGTLTTGYDDATNAVVEHVEPLYTGPMRVWRGNAETTVTSAGQQVTVQPIRVNIPWHVATVEPGMRVQVTQSSDASLLGARLVVMAWAAGTQRVQRRLECDLDEG